MGLILTEPFVTTFAGWREKTLVVVVRVILSQIENSNCSFPFSCEGLSVAFEVDDFSFAFLYDFVEGPVAAFAAGGRGIGLLLDLHGRLQAGFRQTLDKSL